MRPYLRVANVFEDRIDASDLKVMDFSGVFKRYKLEPGDVLLNEGQSPEFLGRPAIYRGLPEDVAFTNTLLRFRAGPHVLPEWALVVFRRHMHFQRFAREARITTNIAHLSASRLKPIEFPVPPLDEQRRIVDVLEDHFSRLDAAAGLVLGAEKRLAALRRSTLQAAISNRDRERVQLGDVVERIEAGKSFGGSAAPATDQQWGVIKVSAMTWGTFRAEENKAVSGDAVNPRYEIRPGNLLVSRANTSGYVGASVLVDAVRPRLLLSDKSLRLVPRTNVDPRWLWLALSSPDARAQISAKATGTKESMRNISQSALLSISIPNPLCVDQEADIIRMETWFDALAALANSLETARRRDKVLRRTLLEAAFTGRLIGRTHAMDWAEEMAGV